MCVHNAVTIAGKALKLYRHYKKKVARYQLQIDKVCYLSCEIIVRECVTCNFGDSCATY